jgi:hypothetical protein
MSNFEIVVHPTDPDSAKKQFVTFLKENMNLRDKLGENDVIRDEIVSDGGAIKHQYRIKSEVLEQVHQ